MKTLQCLIVDDEPVARKIIREFIAQLPFLSLAGECETAAKATQFLKEKDADLVFLDIEMPRQSGLDWLKQSTIKPLVIVTTAYPDYALEGYELAIIDYLLKPIAFSRFKKAVEKAKEYIDSKNSSTAPSPDYIFVKTERRIEKLMLQDIQYVESLGNYVKIVVEGRSLLSYLTLKSMEAQLPATSFIKIHHSYLVNFLMVTAIEGNLVKIKDKDLPLSRGYKDLFMKMVDARMLKRDK